MSSLVGNLLLPVPAGTPNGALEDPTAKGILDYVSFWIRDNLNAKLANMAGTSADALPLINRYTWDPATHFVRNAFPALYVWWNGKSRISAHSMLLDKRVRDIHLMYLFDELEAPHGKRSRAGLIPAVDAIVAKAWSRGAHPNYGYNGDPLGTPIYKSLNLLDWKYEGGEEMFEARVPNVSEHAGGAPEGYVIRGYPALVGTVTVEEFIGQEIPGDDDYLVDGLLSMYAAEDYDAVFYADRYLDPLDGSEEP